MLEPFFNSTVDLSLYRQTYTRMQIRHAKGFGLKGSPGLSRKVLKLGVLESKVYSL